jgi:putative hydrolase of the HAD superfamily
VSPIRLVAFDLDDTLFPERTFVRSGFRVVSDYLQQAAIVGRPLFADMEAAFDAGVRGHVFEQVLQSAGVEPSASLVATLVDVYRTHASRYGRVRPDIQLFPDAEAVLSRLAAKGLKVGLVSDGPLAGQQAKVAALGLAARMDAVILTDEWGRPFWKPHPRAFVELASRLAVDPADCVYVADNPEKDFQGPAASGWRPSIWIRRPSGLYGQAPPAGPVGGTIGGLDELEPALGLA